MQTILIDRTPSHDPDKNQGIIRMNGKDTRRFCNGMFSNNIRDIQTGQLNQSVMLNDKGHIQGQLDIWCIGPEELLVVLEGVPPETFIERYDRFIIMDEVEQQDITQYFGLLSLQGDEAAAILTDIGLPAPPPNQFLDGPHSIRVGTRRRSAQGGYDVIVPIEHVFSIKTALLSGGATEADFSTREWLRISAGQPRWPVDMGEKSLLHELRMVTDYANFNKGCYIGQEVINRIDVMGQVNKKLYGLELSSPPTDKAEIYLGETLVGTLGSWTERESQRRGLAVLRKAAWPPQTTVLVGETRSPARVCELPWEE